MMQVGDIVTYISDNKFVGLVEQIGQYVLKVYWMDKDISEWVPTYSVRIINEYR